MKHNGGKGNIAGLAALITFGVFAVCILLVLFTGAEAYRQMTRRDQRAFSDRTAVQYLTTRVRQADEAGRLSVEPFGDGDALVIREEFDGAFYETRIYCHGGFLCELFSLSGGGMAPEDGEQILEAERLSLELEGRLLWADITGSDGASHRLSLYLRSGEGGAP